MTITVNTPDGGTAQFPDGTPTSAMTSALQAKFGGGGATLSSDNDYSKSPLSAVARTFESSADWGTGDLARAMATGKKPSETAAQSSAAAESLPWYVRYPTEAAGYGLGLVNLMDPVTDAAEAGVLGLGASAKLASLAGLGAEGATVSAVHHVASTDDPGLSDTASAALSGAALNTAAGSAVPLINKGLTKVLGKPGSIDPAVAEAQTKTNRDNLYTQLQSYPVGSNSLKNAYSSATLTPGLVPSVTPGFNALIGRQLDQVEAGGITANDVADFAKDLRAQATSNGDQILAGKISDNLIGALPSDAQKTLQAADKAHQQYMMAQNLGKWQRQVQQGGSVGQQPFTEAERYYTPGTPDYQTVAGLANQGQGHSPATYALGHMAAGAAGALGGSIAGWPGAFVGEGLGYLFARPAIYKAMKGVDQRANIRRIQAAYPQMTGQPLTGATTGPQIPDTVGGYNVGDQIKNLMMGMAY
jgi:hypothetical protein